MAARGRRKSRLAGVDLTWTKDDESAFRVVPELLSSSSKLFFFLIGMPISACFWTRPRPAGPWSSRKCESEVKQHAKRKLQRWALRITGCRYTIEHIAGEHNLWADIVSRWGQPPAELAATSTATVHHVTTRSARFTIKKLSMKVAKFIRECLLFASVGNRAPVEVFTGLQAPSALDTIAVPSDKGIRLVPVDPERVNAQVEKLRRSLRSMHKEAATLKEKKHLYEMARAKDSVCNFEVGDFGL
ncbi:hypothetical protein PInf_017364 [Phytophthora infestans]|nr:hypothetical protein PInf_017364 [Phytophthora infestans]